MEDWIDEYSTRMVNVNKTIKELDYKEYFEEDDEVGIIFREIVKAVSELDIEEEQQQWLEKQKKEVVDTTLQ